MVTPMSDLTRILERIRGGDASASEQLLNEVHGELRRLASAKLARERAGQTLQATALVHEAYLRLIGGESPPQWNGRAHFFAAAAEAMRRILVEAARRKQRRKHGGGQHRVELDSGCLVGEAAPVDMLALDQALQKLTARGPQQAEVVKLRFFAGLTMPQVAEALGISLASAERHWAFARSWLYAELADTQ
jgi:RNA polymerase sigma factor (TIGR02999 family)